ncbi:tRNA-binding protein [Membranihabitans marinus]
MTQDASLISWDDFKKIEIRKGTIVKAEPFPEARQPAYKIWVDFGAEKGVLKTSAQVTRHYLPEHLPGKAVMGVTNFPKKQIGPLMSEFLLVGFEDESKAIILATCDPQVPDGAILK